jgi:hypothetical protein
MVASYIRQAHDVNCSCGITYDAPTGGPGTPTLAELETSSQQLEQTLTNAANAGDPILTTTVINHLNMLRLHFYTGYEFQPERAAVSNARWLSREGHTLDGVHLNIQPGSRVQLDVDIQCIANGATVAFIILGRRYGSARRAINNQRDIQQIHGNLTFPLNNMERDQTGNGVEDQYIARVDKQLSGVDENDRGQQLTAEFIFPREIPRGISSCYFVALIPSSSNTLTGNTTTEHLVTVSSQDLRYPTVCDVFWSSTANGNTRVSVIQDNEPIWIVIETANLPRNCRAIIEIRDRRDATSQSRAEINLQQGNSRAIHSWRTPDIPWLADLFGRDDAYHCSVRVVSRTSGSWEIIWGSSWLDVQ